MADPGLIRAGIAANLASLDMQVSPYELSNPTPPCAYVRLGPVDYDQAFQRGHDEWTFIVVCLVGYATDVGAQMAIDKLLMSHGASSLKALIESDRTLGGAAISLSVPSSTGPRVYSPEGMPAVVGAELTVVVVASGKE